MNPTPPDLGSRADRESRPGRRTAKRGLTTGLASTPLLVAAMLASPGVAAGAELPQEPHARHDGSPETPDADAAADTATGPWMRSLSRADDEAEQASATVTALPASSPTRPAAALAGGSGSPGSYTVVAGDTASEIALHLKVTLRSLLEANGLDADSLIHPGQILRIPGGGTAPASTATSYTVRAGDTLSGIAAEHGTSVSALQHANGLGSSTLIRIGQALRLSGAPSETSSATRAPKDLPHIPDNFAGRKYPDETVNAARINKAALLAANLPGRQAMQRLVARTARAHGVDPSLAQALAYQESGFLMSAVSPANAIGTMQVIPSSGRWASTLAGRKLNLLDPEDNVTAGIVILKKLLDSSPTEAAAIAGYYQGLTSVAENGMYPDTRRYVNSVQTLKSRY